jgi:hypothetical protein
MKIILILMSIFTSVYASADMNQDYELLKNLGRNLQVSGAICEDVARLRFAEKYPAPKYNVVVGIEYKNQNGILGELDVVVFNQTTSYVETIVEVKCWRNPEDGVLAAHEQKDRFFEHIESSDEITFKLISQPQLKLTREQFARVSEFSAIGQKGVLSYGFDYELPYSLDDFNELKDKIVGCQAHGGCKKPMNKKK